MYKKHDYDWKKLIHQQEASGVNMKKFCEQQKLPYSSFKNHKYARSKKHKESQFIPIKEISTSKLTFHINNNEIAVDSSIDDVSLSRIVKALSV